MACAGVAFLPLARPAPARARGGRLLGRGAPVAAAAADGAPSPDPAAASKGKFGMQLAGGRPVIGARPTNRGGEEGTVHGHDVMGVLATSGDCNIFGSALAKAGLSESLHTGRGPYVVFAPHDDAMAALAKREGVTKLGLLALPGLKLILSGHVAETSAVPAVGVDAELQSLVGTQVQLTSGATLANGVRVTRRRPCSNGCVLYVDAVLP